MTEQVVDVYFGFGANEGDRKGNLRQAVVLLEGALGVPCAAISRIMESPAWGFQGQPFLNACVRFSLPREEDPLLQAEGILCACKRIERSMGRREEPLFDAAGRRVYHNRPIDIDILFFGTEQLETEELTVPHPGIAWRDFVKIPLGDIAMPALREAFPELFD